MRLSRYNQILAMTKPRPKRPQNAAQLPAWLAIPSGYGYGDWHQALVDIDAALMGSPNEKKWLAMEATIGRKTKGAGTQTTFKVIDMLEGELDGSHIATLPTQEEWQAIVKKALALVEEPAPDSDEVVKAAHELAAEKKDADLVAANKQILELQQENARLRSSPIQ